MENILVLKNVASVARRSALQHRNHVHHKKRSRFDAVPRGIDASNRPAACLHRQAMAAYASRVATE
jgi:hypothetical protein